MTYLVVKQIQIEADSPEEALINNAKGEVITMSVQKRIPVANPPMAAAAPAASKQSP